jgi:hypothetical protein
MVKNELVGHDVAPRCTGLEQLDSEIYYRTRIFRRQVLGDTPSNPAQRFRIPMPKPVESGRDFLGKASYIRHRTTG